MCDKKNSVLFTDTECVVLSPDFKLTDKSHVLLKVPIKDNMYIVDLKNVVPQGGLTCLFVKATSDESTLWHKRVGHVNFKTINKLVKRNLVRGLPSKLFEIKQTYVACQKGKQHKASCKTKTVSSNSQPLQKLHINLFGPTFVKSLMKKMYCLVVTDDFSRFSWVFFLATKDETSEILKTFITGIENLIDLKVKVIRRNNGIEFKNTVMNQFCEIKGIKRKFSIVRTPKQNGVAEWKNRTLIEAARTMLVDLKLLTTFWAEAVNTACYVQNGADEGFFIGYPTNSKAFGVFNSRTRIVEENLHVKFSENTPNITGTGPNWLFDIDALTKSINYNLVVAGNQSNGSVGKARVVTVPDKDYLMLPLWTQDPIFPSSSKDSPGAEDNVVDENIVYGCVDDLKIPDLEEICRFSDAGNGDSGADVNNFDTNFQVSPVPTTRIHKDHPLEQVIGDLHSAPQTKRMSKNLEEHGLARLMAQGHIQEEGIDYDEVFASVTRIEAIRLFLAYASFKDFVVYQMDVKSTFVYEKI
uniref:Integrase catalytic domain-containing protein n=1 Tax=Tanacetum cinerariifolium TaxID=118510 RepID=A0A699I9H9_TANCI|nr:hypothetical protein [Tanacetum cinerariifolium]